MTESPSAAPVPDRWTAHRPACPACQRPLDSQADAAVQVGCPHRGCPALLSTTRRCAACRGHAVVPREVAAWRCSCTGVNVPAPGRGRRQRAPRRGWVGAAVAVVAAGTLVVAVGAARDDPGVPAGPDPDASFRRVLAGSGLDDSPVSEADAERFARDVCATVDGGADAQAMARLLMARGLDVGQAGTVLGAAASAYCPQNMTVMLEQLDEG